METLSSKKPKTKPDLSKTSILTPQPGANGPSDDMVLVFAGRLIEQEAIIKVGRNKLKTIRQQAHNAGITLKRLERAQKFADGDGIDALVEEYRETMRYTGILMGAPVGKQLEFFKNPATDREVSQEDLLYAAFHKGRVRGLLKQPPDDEAYPVHTDLGQEHLRGHADGDEQRRLQEKLTENSEAAAAADKAKKDAKKKAKKDGIDATVTIIEGTLADLDREPAEA